MAQQAGRYGTNGISVIVDKCVLVESGGPPQPCTAWLYLATPEMWWTLHRLLLLVLPHISQSTMNAKPRPLHPGRSRDSSCSYSYSYRKSIAVTCLVCLIQLEDLAQGYGKVCPIPRH